MATRWATTSLSSRYRIRWPPSPDPTTTRPAADSRRTDTTLTPPARTSPSASDHARTTHSGRCLTAGPSARLSGADRAQRHAAASAVPAAGQPAPLTRRSPGTPPSQRRSNTARHRSHTAPRRSPLPNSTGRNAEIRSPGCLRLPTSAPTQMCRSMGGLWRARRFTVDQHGPAPGLGREPARRLFDAHGSS